MVRVEYRFKVSLIGKSKDFLLVDDDDILFLADSFSPSLNAVRKEERFTYSVNYYEKDSEEYVQRGFDVYEENGERYERVIITVIQTIKLDEVCTKLNKEKISWLRDISFEMITISDFIKFYEAEFFVSEIRLDEIKVGQSLFNTEDFGEFVLKGDMEIKDPGF